jgi:hypothetical protein
MPFTILCQDAAFFSQKTLLLTSPKAYSIRIICTPRIAKQDTMR